VQNIISGWQTLTVYKYVPDEANAAAAAAIALYKGAKPRVTGLSKGKPAFIVPVSTVTKANYKQLFANGFLKRSEVCSGEYKKYCK
jgi:D-xylose transport system substrate-binding protein